MINIIHYIAGPSWRSFVYARLIKMRVNSKGAKTVISFIHPKWSCLASMTFRFSLPDAVVVQSDRWKAYCLKIGIKLWDRPIVGVDLNKFRQFPRLTNNVFVTNLTSLRKKRLYCTSGILIRVGIFFI